MKKRDVLLAAIIVVCVGIIVIFGIPGILSFADERLGELLSEALPRLASGILLAVLMVRCGYAQTLRWNRKAGGLLWCTPCLLVAVVNFPFSALIGGAASIERLDLLGLFLVKCAATALLEELFFRGLLLSFFTEWLHALRYRLRILLAVLLTSLLFALLHVLNLFFGAGVGDTLLQVGYTFLLGCMLAVMFFRTKNLWFCVAVHAIFNIGGTIVTDLGSGAFQDTVFWVLTAVAGVICAVHILLSFLKMTERGEM